MRMRRICEEMTAVGEGRKIKALNQDVLKKDFVNEHLCLSNSDGRLIYVVYNR